jgi:hypothetical protein
MMVGVADMGWIVDFPGGGLGHGRRGVNPRPGGFLPDEALLDLFFRRQSAPWIDDLCLLILDF